MPKVKAGPVVADRLKARKALKKGMPRRKTCTKCPEEFLRGHQCASDHFIEHIERNKAPREMIAADIGCFRWGPDLEVRFEEGELLDRRRSLLSRLKSWWPV